LFLDEVGDLPLELQPRLLRAVQEQQVERLGSGGRATSVDVRVIAATHQDLGEMVQIVVITQTLMLPAGMAVPDTGVVFNNGMSYFSTDPQDIHFVEAGERPRFVMSPTIVTRHGQPYFALGSAGGWTIPQTILQVVVRALDFHMDAQDAVKAPRFVLQHLGDSIP
jgi:gamma-glutamyltranspeptidase